MGLIYFEDGEDDEEYLGMDFTCVGGMWDTFRYLCGWRVVEE